MNRIRILNIYTDNLRVTTNVCSKIPVVQNNTKGCHNLVMKKIWHLGKILTGDGPDSNFHKRALWAINQAAIQKDEFWNMGIPCMVRDVKECSGEIPDVPLLVCPAEISAKIPSLSSGSFGSRVWTRSSERSHAMANEKFCCTWVALADTTSKTHQSQRLHETLSCQIFLSLSLSLHACVLRCWCARGPRARVLGLLIFDTWHVSSHIYYDLMSVERGRLGMEHENSCDPDRNRTSDYYAYPVRIEKVPILDLSLCWYGPIDSYKLTSFPFSVHLRLIRKESTSAGWFLNHFFPSLARKNLFIKSRSLKSLCFALSVWFSPRMGFGQLKATFVLDSNKILLDLSRYRFRANIPGKYEHFLEIISSPLSHEDLSWSLGKCECIIVYYGHS